MYSVFQDKLDTFKLTLSQIDIINLFENIYRPWSGEDVVKVTSKLMHKNIELQLVKNKFTHTWSLQSFYYRFMYYAAPIQCTDISIFSIVLCALYITYLNRLFVCVKWFSTICQKKTPISLLQHKFWCHFHHILAR